MIRRTDAPAANLPDCPSRSLSSGVQIPFPSSVPASTKALYLVDPGRMAARDGAAATESALDRLQASWPTRPRASSSRCRTAPTSRPRRRSAPGTRIPARPSWRTRSSTAINSLVDDVRAEQRRPARAALDRGRRPRRGDPAGPGRGHDRDRQRVRVRGRRDGRPERRRLARRQRGLGRVPPRLHAERRPLRRLRPDRVRLLARRRARPHGRDTAADRGAGACVPRRGRDRAAAALVRDRLRLPLRRRDRDLRLPLGRGARRLVRRAGSTRRGPPPTPSAA